MPSLYEMANAVRDLVALKQDHLRGCEHVSHMHGFEPGPDVGFMGMRLVIAEGDAAAKFLQRLAPHQEAFERWFEGHLAAASMSEVSGITLRHV